eukprot:GFKZ01005417.1.p1 GENE.GFKZ01005417.1~~GFKZ01005417.1.p1  ORF type:complete len:575 (+),score=86.68 GFKZ01005417.1:334-2058(+)
MAPAIDLSPISSTIRKPIGHSQNRDRIIQLWVEHGSRISARSAILISQTNNAHSEAVSARSLASIEQFMPQPAKKSSPFGKVAASPSFLARRRQIREQRSRYVLELERREHEQERARELKLAQLKEERDREQRAKNLQLQAEERQRAEARAQQIRAAEAQKELERAAREEEETETRKRLASNPANGQNVRAKSTRPDAPVVARNEAPGRNEQDSIGTATKFNLKNAEIDDGKAELGAVEQKSAPRRDPNVLMRPIIAKGNSGDKILECEGAPPDVSHIIQEWNNLCDQAEPFRREPSMKKPRLEVKKQVNLMVNQIAASVKQVSVKVENLCQVLRNASSGGGPSGEAFAMKEIAQRLVSESDGSVALNRTAAFAVGAVIVGVAAGCREPSRMRNTFLGAFYRHCIYTIPAYAIRDKGESAEDFRYRIGYKDGETPEGYMERSCGCVSLFAAVLHTDKVIGVIRGGSKAENPFSLDVGWTWLARITNRGQRAITPAITFAFLEIAGHAMSKKYKKQFAKLMASVQKIVVLKAVRQAPKGAISRMDTLLDDFLTAGCVFPKPPKGSVLPKKDMEFL